MTKISKGAVTCSVDLSRREDDVIMSSKSDVTLGDVLITRIHKTE